MLNNLLNRISQLSSLVIEKLNEFPLTQLIKSKWEELDQQNRTYAKYGMISVIGLSFFYTLLSMHLQLRSLEKSIETKTKLLSTVQKAVSDMQSLSIPPASHAMKDQTWSAYIQSLATNSRMAATAVQIGEEKKSKTDNDQYKESFFEITIKQTNIKQLVSFLYSLETGSRPVKLKDLQIETKGDAQGILDAQMGVQAFVLLK